MILAPDPSKPFSLTPDAAEVVMFQYSSVGDTVLVPAGTGVWEPVYRKKGFLRSSEFVDLMLVPFNDTSILTS